MTESGSRRFEKLDARFTHRQHGGVNFFDRHGLAEGHGQSKLVAIELERLVDGAHGDPEMINLRT